MPNTTPSLREFWTAPTPQDVAAFLGRPGDAAFVALAEHHLSHVGYMVRAYTRGAGFAAVVGVGGTEVDVPAPDLASVIVTATARLVTNPTLAKSENLGSWSTNYGSLFSFSLAEQVILNAYRRRAA